MVYDGTAYGNFNDEGGGTGFSLLFHLTSVYTTIGQLHLQLPLSFKLNIPNGCKYIE
jgi:hypothetical protein